MTTIERLVNLALAVESGAARGDEPRELATAVLDLFGREATGEDSLFAFRVGPETAAVVAPIFLHMGECLAKAAEAAEPETAPTEHAGSC